MQSTLRHIILVSAHPRTLIQITLQITANWQNDAVLGHLPQASSVGSLAECWLTRY